MYIPQITVERIKAEASKKGVSMSKLNGICELSRNTIAQSAKGTEGMKAKNLYMIAETLGCSVDYLLGRTDDPIANVGDTNNNSSAGSPKNDELDEMSSSLLEGFNTLRTADKARIIVMIDEMRKGA